MIRIFIALFLHDTRLIWRNGHALRVVAFMFIAVGFLPFALGPRLDVLRGLAPGLLWAVLLLTLIVSFDRLFRADAEDGHLDRLMLLPAPLEWVALAKIAAHFVAVIVPLLVALPVAGLLVNIAPSALPPVMLAVALGSPALALWGAFGAALTVRVARPGLLTALLIMPLYVPIMIFGATATRDALGGGDAAAALVALGLFSLAALAAAPLAVAAALRANMR